MVDQDGDIPMEDCTIGNLSSTIGSGEVRPVLSLLPYRTRNAPIADDNRSTSTEKNEQPHNANDKENASRAAPRRNIHKGTSSALSSSKQRIRKRKPPSHVHRYSRKNSTLKTLHSSVLIQKTPSPPSNQISRTPPLQSVVIPETPIPSSTPTINSSREASSHSEQSYLTAKSRISGTSHFSVSPSPRASSTNMLRGTSNTYPNLQQGGRNFEEFNIVLKRIGVASDILTEQNWAGREPGRGQHVKFEDDDMIPLEFHGEIGTTKTAIVERVKCKRIMLARKSMRYGVRTKLTDAVNELKHLHTLRHAHIIRLVGSYVQGTIFAILLYPVAEWNLKAFVSLIEDSLRSPDGLDYNSFLKVAALGSFFRCLADGLAYIHNNTTKHMDIKPQNILVKVSDESEDAFGFRVYIADFGTSRNFSDEDSSQTDSSTNRTPIYCAPEVYWGERWGRSADIFSLGCVFLEMQTALCRHSVKKIEEFRSTSQTGTSFHANIARALDWCQALKSCRPIFVVNLVDGQENHENIAGMEHRHSVIARNRRWCDTLQTMFARDPSGRPKAEFIALQMKEYDKCCIAGPADFKEETNSLQTFRTHTPPVDRFSGLPPPQRNMVLVRVVETGDKQLADSVFSMCKLNRINLEEIRNDRGDTLRQIAEMNGYWSILQVLNC